MQHLSDVTLMWFTAVFIRSKFTLKIFLFALVNKLSSSCLGILGEQADTFLLVFFYLIRYVFQSHLAFRNKSETITKLFMKKKLQ